MEPTRTCEPSMRTPTLTAPEGTVADGRMDATSNSRPVLVWPKADEAARSVRVIPSMTRIDLHTASIRISSAGIGFKIGTEPHFMPRHRFPVLISAFVFFCALPSMAEEGMWTFDNPPTRQLKDKYNFTPDKAWL